MDLLYRPVYIRIFIHLFVLIQCDSEVRVNLTAVVGSSITFPDPVKERGFLSFGPKFIASVSNGVLEIEESVYTKRLHWNSTGYINFSNLQKNDSGVYSIDSKKGNVFSKYYELLLFDPVSVPVVSCVNESADSRSVRCSVNKTEQTTLSWFRGDQPVDSGRSGVLLLTVQRQDYNLTFKCVAQNHADNKTTTVDIATICNTSKTRSFNSSGAARAHYAYIAIPIALTVLLVCFGIFYKKKCSKKESTTFQTQDSVQYAQINFRKRTVDQSVNTSPGSGHPDLTTVYDKIEKHRMTPTYSNCGEVVS